jgi:hypothetical protein
MYHRSTGTQSAEPISPHRFIDDSHAFQALAVVKTVGGSGGRLIQ